MVNQQRHRATVQTVLTTTIPPHFSVSDTIEALTDLMAAKAPRLYSHEIRTAHYAVTLPAFFKVERNELPFLYESTGVETYFRNMRDPEPRSRHVFTFHKPETLMEWASQADSLRQNLAKMPAEHLLVKTGMRDCQVEAITHLEQSFATAHPRALIQMATGAGKTYTACAFT